nr:unnamed protein product [Callosobruchus analis]
MTSTALPLLPYLANTPIVVCLASTAVSSPLGFSRCSSFSISVYLVSIMDSRVVAAASFVVLSGCYKKKIQKFKSDFLSPFHFYFENTPDEHATTHTRRKPKTE